MAKVQILERSVAERIAAGEVVERPASVVKELIENSLDAGARRISVELQNGGMAKLRVVDDGCGMAPEDLALAVERFATSKIRQWEDLDSLSSLGFRGEALPSIAAVARLEIVTCEADAAAATELIIQGGVVERSGAAPGVPGTRITVTDLFYNTPARRKFLKSPGAETGQIVDLVGRLALICPGVQFQVRSNGREVLMMPSQLGTAQRLAQLWKIPAEDFVHVQGEHSGLSLDGWVALPRHARANRTAQTFSVNGRIIRSQTLSQAVLEGFTPLLPKGRYPVGLLQITLDPAQVDVNVHPTKAEVRFADNRAPFRVIYRSIAAALERAGADTVRDQDWEVLGEPEEPPALPPPAPVEQVREPERPWSPPPRPFTPPPRPQAPPEAVLEMFRPLPESGGGVRVLAQLYRTFIVAEVEGELWVVDQHTAHERIWYERLGSLNPLEGARQGLLVPEVMELPPASAAFLEAQLGELESLGFEVEPFGPGAFQLRALPMGMKPGRAGRILREVVEEGASGGFSVRGDAREVAREKLRAMVSCKSAVKAGDPMQQHEMQVLIEEMLRVEHSLYCPHGRPTRVKLDRRALERLFHR